MAEQITTPAQLRAIVAGLTDEALEAWTRDPGMDVVLAPIFAGMRERFLPARAAGQTAVIQYDIAGPDGVSTWQASIADGACAVAQGAAQTPAVTIQMAFPDFLRLVTGKLNPVMAFMSGKLKLRGDLMLAQTQSTWFDQRIEPPEAPGDGAG
ncbi:MAG TPA: SCP2 sterol-binding domain-containing protein [Candidatus Dormibacteraeota bacterium]|jgi:putative sterol carrier protein|nr:SCP2 sterol-binding domain-containing protein [Candidatus Dormibacteraeota bacterium]